MSDNPNIGLSLSQDVNSALSISSNRYPVEAAHYIGAYYALSQDCEKILHQNGIVFNSEAFFYNLEMVVILFLFRDGKFDEDEWRCYQNICTVCSFRALSQAECTAIYTQLKANADLARSAIGGMVEMRRIIRLLKESDLPYQAFLIGLWSLCLLNGAIAESEFDLMSEFYDPRSDRIPSSFNELKKQLA